MTAVADTIEQASPLLARQVEALCSAARPETRQLRRAVVSVMRYMLRMTGRATPNGLFAGIAPASFGVGPGWTWGECHRAVARADGDWIADLIAQVEAIPEILRHLNVTANNTAYVRGNRLVLPYPPRSHRSQDRAAAEMSLRYTSAVRIAVKAAASPVPVATVVERVKAQFPDVALDRVEELVTNLIERGVLISSLHAPSATLDALDHLVQQIAGVCAPPAPGLVADLRAVRDAIRQHNQVLAPADGRRQRTALRHKMTALSTATTQPMTLDLHMDCSLTLPSVVAREAEAAVTVLARLTAYPFGAPAWKDFHNRFFERYGINTLVPVRDLVDPDVGLGFPAGYRDAEPAPREVLTPRAQRLLSLAQAAVLDGRDEIVLDENLVRTLTAVDQDSPQVPAHTELRFRIRATSQAALENGDFTLHGVAPSRGIGTTIGRSLGLLTREDQARAAAVLEELPVNTPGSLPTQVSFTPIDRGDANVTRVTDLLPTVISLAEHRPVDERTIPLDDLAVGCDRRRLYLVSLSRRCLLDPMTLHALDLRVHTPPLARFLTEISRSQTAVLTGFPWAPATALPYLPRVRYGRTVLSPARWRLDRTDLPDRTKRALPSAVGTRVHPAQRPTSPPAALRRPRLRPPPRGQPHRPRRSALAHGRRRRHHGGIHASTRAAHRAYDALRRCGRHRHAHSIHLPQATTTRHILRPHDRHLPRLRNLTLPQGTTGSSRLKATRFRDHPPSRAASQNQLPSIHEESSVAYTRANWSKHYNDGHSFSRLSAEEKYLLVEHAPAPVGGRALDVGCGTGELVAFLASLGYTVDGTDFAEGALTRARAEHAAVEGVRWLCLDVEHDDLMPLSSDGYDLITLRLSIAFIRDRARVLRRLTSRLRINGVLIVITPHTNHTPTERRSIALDEDELACLADGYQHVKRFDTGGFAVLVLQGSAGSAFSFEEKQR
ncbi:lantibiotic dehydratase [Streptomyces sp. NPDC004528]|uniref:lantibiotic dehydratase n=1 Tax=Streptomyces sp. NPDC004528 TaxID=3154550 RepID=UPI0033BC3F32